MQNAQSTSVYKQIKTSEAAEFLGLTQRKLEQMRMVGNGPKFVRVSQRCVRYRMIDLIKFQEENLKESTLD